MMMPANYSVIAENEMTYVNGGASFIDAIGAVTAPIWDLTNVKAFLPFYFFKKRKITHPVPLFLVFIVMIHETVNFCLL